VTEGHVVMASTYIWKPRVRFPSWQLAVMTAVSVVSSVPPIQLWYLQTDHRCFHPIPNLSYITIH